MPGRRELGQWRPAQPNSLEKQEYSHWLCFIISASEEQLRRHSVISNVSTEAVRRRQAEARGSLGVTRHRRAAWTLKPCERQYGDSYLHEALQRLGLHPKPWVGDHWKAVLRGVQIAWEFTYSSDGYLLHFKLWDAAGQWYRSLPWGRMEFRRVYYSDRKRGAQADWIPYLYVESAASDYCCDCRREQGEGCGNCSPRCLLIPATQVAGHRICEHVMRLLTLLQMRRSRHDSAAAYHLTLELVGVIGSFLWREGAGDV